MATQTFFLLDFFGNQTSSSVQNSFHKMTVDVVVVFTNINLIPTIFPGWELALAIRTTKHHFRFSGFINLSLLMVIRRYTWVVSLIPFV